MKVYEFADHEEFESMVTYLSETEGPGLEPEHSMHENCFLHEFVAIPGEEKFQTIKETYNDSGEQSQLGALFKMINGDNVHEMKGMSNKNQKNVYHRKTRIDCSRYKERGDHGRVPPRIHARRKIQCDDTMNRYHQRCRDDGEISGCLLECCPFPNLPGKAQ